MLTDSLHAELAEALRTQGPEAAIELARARGLTVPARDGELTDGELEAVAAGKTFIGGGGGWGWGGGFFARGFFFRRRAFFW